jgi:hypothetical protein
MMEALELMLTKYCGQSNPTVEVVSQDHSPSIRAGVKEILISSEGGAPLAGDCWVHMLRSIEKKAYRDEIKVPSDTKDLSASEWKDAFLSVFKSWLQTPYRSRTTISFPVLLEAVKNECHNMGQHAFFTKFVKTYGMLILVFS